MPALAQHSGQDPLAKLYERRIVEQRLLMFLQPTIHGANEAHAGEACRKTRLHQRFGRAHDCHSRRGVLRQLRGVDPGDKLMRAGYVAGGPFMRGQVHAMVGRIAAYVEF